MSASEHSSMGAAPRPTAPRSDPVTTPLSDVLGAEVTGVDLREPLDTATLAAIEHALLEHHLLVFRDQALDANHQVDFSVNFGELEEHVIRRRDGGRMPALHVVSNLDENGEPTPTPHSHGNYFWHTDKSYHEIPSLVTLLHAKTLPPEGGDTQFANMHLGYDALPAARRAQLEGLQVVHSWEASRINSGNRPASEEEKRERPPVTHPLVRTHPASRRKLLYLGIHTSHVVGMPRDEGRALLAELLEFCTQPRFTHTHRWSAGDLVMWDNRCLMHRALRNYDMARWPRVLHRTVIKGSKPY